MADLENIPRWSLATFNKAVTAVAGDIPVYLEGDERDLGQVSGVGSRHFGRDDAVAGLYDGHDHGSNS